jgi:hypothetical protein
MTGSGPPSAGGSLAKVGKANIKIKRTMVETTDIFLIVLIPPFYDFQA